MRCSSLRPVSIEREWRFPTIRDQFLLRAWSNSNVGVSVPPPTCSTTDVDFLRTTGAGARYTGLEVQEAGGAGQGENEE